MTERVTDHRASWTQIGWVLEPGTLLLHGSLTRPAIEASVKNDLPDMVGPEIEINLGRVDSIDTSGVALLVGWEAEGAARGLQLRYTHAPNAMKAMLDVYGLSDILDVAERKH